ncbi:acetamidase/formamidase family protein [Sulfolobus acidocaldarius]|uniref:Conserved formamidase/acetamidase n=4 Tax=Sulfolobus acidocaldarius TaxID=2285 RepID=Q4J6Y5_SULAC|nr:acetamidase/formamidase family protein [Sulfolobus acidocaldarius]AAY81445.1 conserved formamidase/acetamidase [Sulfolobus acidocaldarius DSM 639]AGE72045.1 formamidase/acetamidase [Sulfolobus acidocaldarius N8]AGE74362.1 formamidase/acetamidase [Sulfolobus acidocaldarius Ron12/I]ALU29767.1 acetamidase [Sulfolobus acidocaldarius]ALU32504.1 acetamidase [Sulfolobus acidocaldarius]
MQYTIHAITHNKWDNSLQPVLKVSDGDVITLETKEASDGQVTPSSSVQDLLKLDFSRIHPLTGPIEVIGAEPGDALEVEFLDFRNKGWGWTGVLPGFGFLADEQYTSPIDVLGPALKIWKADDKYAYAKFGDLEVSVPLHPFPGVIGVALPQRGRFSTIPPRENGGNMDIKHLTIGTKLYLPVFVNGALLSVGDTHLAQGDGEVCGTAIEGPMEVTIKIRLLKNVGLSQPVFITKRVKEMEFNEYIAFPGIDRDLWIASKKAVRGIISILSKYMTPVEAYMLASTVVNLRVSEVVDVPNWIVTAYLPKDVLGRDIQLV